MFKATSKRMALILLLILINIVFSSTADNIILDTQLTVSDVDPYNLTITDVWFLGYIESTDFTPSAGTDYRVNCSLFVRDDNGYQDLDSVWASLFLGYDAGACSNSSDLDSDLCYLDSSCSVVTGSGDGNTQYYHCDFGMVEHFADHGNWTIIAYANDSDGGLNTSNSTSRLVNSLKSLSAASSVNFGARGAGDVVDTIIAFEINNTGNNDLSVSVKGNRDMHCSRQGIIPIENIKYSLVNNTVFSTACGALNQTDGWGCSDFIISDEQDPSDSEHVKSMYWGINISEGVSGTCSNTITFTAN